jgi:hypothetical protein
MSSSEAAPDNLERIRGIGPDVRKWLAEAFDVRTFGALADLSGEEITDRIKAENKPSIWLRWARDWPIEAAGKVAEMDTELNSPVREEDREQEEDEDWGVLARYAVEFQSRLVLGETVERRTTVCYEGPGQETPPKPVDEDGIFQWIFEHLDGVLRAEPGTEARPDDEAEIAPREYSPSTVSISRLRLFQPTGAGSPLFSYSSEQPQLRSVAADQPFDLEAILEESQPSASAGRRIAFNVQFYVKNWDTREATTLGSVEPKAIEDQLAYSALLPGISLPRGKYRLELLVLARPKPVVLDSIAVPLLSVW